MKKAYLLSQVDERKCIGDKICENVCPTGAIKVVNRKARVDETKCAACLECLDMCNEGAIRMVPRERPLTMGVDPLDVDQDELQALCDRARFDPDDPICLCTLTPAKEVAAAILKGAQTPEEVTLMTGIRTSCGMWCMAPILRLLKAHGLETAPPKGYRWYDVDANLWDIPEAVSQKYPEYYLEEDKKLYDESMLDNLILMLT